jgi:RES domain-containing protein
VRSRSKSKSKKRKRAAGRSFVIDSFTLDDLEFWTNRTFDMQSYADRAHYDLERQRVKNHDALCAALRVPAAIRVTVDGWIRVTDWRWNLTPLSPAGSVREIGGRFNIGRELDRARGQHFPALYIAKDHDTAFREYFGGPLTSSVGKMTRGELALRTEASFSTFSLRGSVEQVFDARTSANLGPFLQIISKFELSKETRRRASALRLPQISIFRKPTQLWRRLLAAPSTWRTEPQLSGIPAASQIFGRFLRDAGLEGVLYMSQRGGNECLAVFPENLKGSDSRIEVAGDAPAEATCTLMDREHLCLEGT